MNNSNTIGKLSILFTITVIFGIWLDNFIYINNDAINYVDQANFYTKNNFLPDSFANSIYPIFISLLSNFFKVSLHTSAKLISLFSGICIYILFNNLNKVQCGSLHNYLISSIVFLSSYGFLDNYFFMIYRDNLFILFSLMSIYFIFKFDSLGNNNFLLYSFLALLFSAFFRIEGLVISSILILYMFNYFFKLKLNNYLKIFYFFSIFLIFTLTIYFFGSEIKINDLFYRLNLPSLKKVISNFFYSTYFDTFVIVFSYFFITLFYFVKINFLSILFFLLNYLNYSLKKIHLLILFIYLVPCFILIFFNYVSRDVISMRYFVFIHFIVLIFFNYNFHSFIYANKSIYKRCVSYIIMFIMFIMFLDNIDLINKNKININFENAELVSHHINKSYSNYYVSSNNKKFSYYLNNYLNNFKEYKYVIYIHDKKYPKQHSIIDNEILFFNEYISDKFVISIGDYSND